MHAELQARQFPLAVDGLRVCFPGGKNPADRESDPWSRAVSVASNPRLLTFPVVDELGTVSSTLLLIF